MSLADIRTKSKQKPPRLVVYGGAGIGIRNFSIRQFVGEQQMRLSWLKIRYVSLI